MDGFDHPCVLLFVNQLKRPWVVATTERYLSEFVEVTLNQSSGWAAHPGGSMILSDHL